MSLSQCDRVNVFLNDLESVDSDRYAIVLKLRTLFMKHKVTCAEDIKYGGLVFMVANELVGGIFVYDKHMSVEFSQGAEFEDVNGILEGKGKFRRHVKIREFSDVKKKNVKTFVGMALTSV